ncbi:MAG: shikimate kinase [Betaproteobacteria bacterium]|nr:shikimate kinase [Betaproteobacteria bacterium]NBT75849.1 shikimate kinase [Betaproteobacteria bacterium]NBY14549.1 shikimate kinase [Betaproteobacteria bacterium]NCA16122.1 shikimate kinase [Betaproteobacteria bacterium]NDF03589.1 shikimate kinase [Betaproteobacteria bacterium]
MRGLDTQNIVLIGLMGAGKSTVGRKLAQRIGWPLVDTDQEIVARCGADVSTIFDMEGEDGFRRREARVIEEVMSRGHQVVTTGGGAPLLNSNRDALSKGFVIYLYAEPAQLWQRLRNDQSRPILARSTDMRATIEELYRVRDPIYRAMAQAIVASARGSLTQVVQEIEGRLVQEGIVEDA